jgi:hypothetical protein
MGGNVELDQALAAAEAEVPECVAVSYVDATTGALLGLRASDPIAHGGAALVAASTTELLRSAALAAAESVFDRGRHERAPSPTEEIVVTAREHVHLVIRLKTRRNRAVVFVCRASVEADVALGHARAAAAALEATTRDPFERGSTT